MEEIDEIFKEVNDFLESGSNEYDIKKLQLLSKLSSLKAMIGFNNFNFLKSIKKAEEKLKKIVFKHFELTKEN